MGQLMRARVGHMRSKSSRDSATKADDDDAGENVDGDAETMNFDFTDIVEAESRVASVDVTIPWYIIDPQGHNIKKQRLRELAKRKLHDETKDKKVFEQRMRTSEQSFRARRSNGIGTPNAVTVHGSNSPTAVLANETPQAKQAQASDAMRPLDAMKTPQADDPMTPQAKPASEAPAAPLELSLLKRLTIFPFWDGVTTVALLFTVIVTPFEVGFLKAPTSVNDLNTLFFINRIVDAIFIVDGAAREAEPPAIPLPHAIAAACYPHASCSLLALSRAALCSSLPHTPRSASPDPTLDFHSLSLSLSPSLSHLHTRFTPPAPSRSHPPVLHHGAQEAGREQRGVGPVNRRNAAVGDQPQGHRNALRSRLVYHRRDLRRPVYLRHPTAAGPGGRIIRSRGKGAAHHPRPPAHQTASTAPGLSHVRKDQGAYLPSIRHRYADRALLQDDRACPFTSMHRSKCAARSRGDR